MPYTSGFVVLNCTDLTKIFKHSPTNQEDGLLKGADSKITTDGFIDMYVFGSWTNLRRNLSISIKDMKCLYLTTAILVYFT